VLFAEKTGYGTVIAGSLDVAGGSRTQFAETRGKVSFVAANPGVVRIDEGKQSTLINADTGAMVEVPSESSARMTGLGLLTWSPKSAPTRARLLEPSRWVPVATWAGKAEPNPEPPVPSESKAVTAAKPTAATKPAPSGKPTAKVSAAALAAEAAKAKPTATGKSPTKPTPKSEPGPATTAKKPPATAKATEKPKKKTKAKPEVEVSVRRRGG